MSNPNGRLAGKHVVVTGAGTGIGRAIALRLASEGARLSLLARRAGPLTETANRIAGAGGHPAGVHACDIRDRAAVGSAFGAARRERGDVFALVACSGIGGANGPGDGPDRFDEIVRTNVDGTYHCLRAAEGVLAPGPDPRHLVVIASILARLGVPGYTGYCASKAALCGMVRAFAAELAPRNVQVNAVLPGWVETDMAIEGLQGMARAMNTDLDGARRTALAAVPLGRFGQPEDVAGMIAWLLGPDARGVTGASLDMNNGAFMS